MPVKLKSQRPMDITRLQERLLLPAISARAAHIQSPAQTARQFAESYDGENDRLSLTDIRWGKRRIWVLPRVLSEKCRVTPSSGLSQIDQLNNLPDEP